MLRDVSTCSTFLMPGRFNDKTVVFDCFTTSVVACSMCFILSLSVVVHVAFHSSVLHVFYVALYTI